MRNPFSSLSTLIMLLPKIFSIRFWTKLLVLMIFLIPQIKADSLFAQIAESEELSNLKFLVAGNAVGALTYSNIQGTPYYTDEFISSTVHLKDQDQEISIPLRYDLYQDELEFQQDGKSIWILKNQVSYILYGNDSIIPSVTAENSYKQSYFFVKGNGEYALYIRRKVNFYPFEPTSSYAVPKPNRFESELDEYFIKKPNSLPTIVDRKKELLKLFKEDEAVLAFIKKSKIRVNEKDLISLVEFLNR